MMTVGLGRWSTSCWIRSSSSPWTWGCGARRWHRNRQGCSAVWVLKFLTGRKAILRLRLRNLALGAGRVKSIVALGLSGFFMNLTNSLVQVVCNATLQLLRRSIRGHHDHHQLPAGGVHHAGTGLSNGASR